MIDVLFSGGMDSWVHLNWAITKFGHDRVRAVYIDGGQRYADMELPVARRLAARLSVPLLRVEIDWLREDERTGHISLRNLIFILRVAAREDSEGVVFGMLHGEASEDKNIRFVNDVQLLLDSQLKRTIYSSGREFRIFTPFAFKTKTQMLDWYLRSSAFIDQAGYIYMTYGCYAIFNSPCGECQACFNRWVAMYNNHLREDSFLVHPYDWFLDKWQYPRDVEFGMLWYKRRVLWDIVKAINRYGHEERHERVLMELVRRFK